MPRWRATSTRGVCPIRTWWSAPPAKCDSATSCCGSRRPPSSTAPRRSGPISPMPTSTRRSPHTSDASAALARAPRRSPIEVADAKPAEPPLAAPRRSNMVVTIITATVLGLGTLVFVRDWQASLTRWALAVGGSLYLAFTLSFYLSLYFLHQPDPNHLGFGYVIAVFGAIW